MESIAETRSFISMARLVSLTSAGLFVLAVAALHTLRPELDAAERMVSEYAVGDYGVLMTLSFLAMAAACLAVSLGLFRALSAEGVTLAGLILIGVWATVMVLFAVFPIGVGDTVDSTSDVIHRSIAPIGFFGLPVGVFLVSRSFRGAAEWTQMAIPGMIVAVTMLLAAFAFFFSYGTDGGFEGLAQRVFIFAFLGWLVAVAWRMKDTHSVSRAQ